MSDRRVIAQIQIPDDGEPYDIDAKYWGGHEFNDVTDALHGVVDTFVISETNSESSPNDYNTIVTNVSTTMSTTRTILDSLVDIKPSGGYKVGDIVLLEKTDSFDRWVSKISGETVYLTVLETQVGKHHHTVSLPSLTQSSSLALVSYNAVMTDSTFAVALASIKVITSVSGIFLTSVSYLDEGKNELKLKTSTESGDVGHKHTISFTPTSIVSRNIPAYTGLSTSSYTPHKHNTASVDVADKISSTESVNYVTGVSTSDTFIKTLISSKKNTGGASKTTTGNNESGKVTSLQVSGSTIGDDLKTSDVDNHTHNVSVTTGSNKVVTSVNIAAQVVTSVSFNAGTLQKKVITDVTTSKYTVPTAWGDANISSFLNACVVNDGILSFTSGNAVTSAKTITSSKEVEVVNVISSGNQNIASLTAPSVEQSSDMEDVTLNVSETPRGGHQHGFNHNHTIDSHTHSFEHTHEYVRTDVSSTGIGITSLSTGSHQIHTHVSTNPVKVAGSSTDDNPLTYVYGGVSKNVVRELKSSFSSFTVSSVYHSLDGDITFPTIKGITESVRITSTSIRPVRNSYTQVISSITITSAKFITDINYNSTSVDTGENIGGSN